MLWEEESKQFNADIERVQVWDALSEFYLDSYRDAKDLERIAQILARSPFTLDELWHIEFCEVRPVCASNLFSLAGEWALFDPDWLIPRCLELQSKIPYRANAKLSFWQNLSRTTFPSNVPRKRIIEIRQGASRAP